MNYLVCLCVPIKMILKGMCLFQYRACEENHRNTFISWISRRNHAYMFSIGVSVETKHHFNIV